MSISPRCLHGERHDVSITHISVIGADVPRKREKSRAPWVPPICIAAMEARYVPSPISVVAASPRVLLYIAVVFIQGRWLPALVLYGCGIP